MSNEENKNLPARREQPNKLVLNPTMEISLEGLPPEVVQQLRAEHAKGMIDVQILAAKYGVETRALNATLRNMAEETISANRENTHITVTRLQEDSLGKTEVIMGNTETARKGKLSRAQSGLTDYTLAYIVAGVIIIIVLASIMKK